MREQIRQYLFDEMTPADRESFQSRLLSDQALSDEVKDQETDWIDAYAAGRLSPEESTAFGRYLAATGQQDRILFARAMAKPPVSRRLSVFAPALALAAVLVIGFGSVFLNQRRGAAIPVAGGPEIAGTPIYLSPGALRDGGPVQAAKQHNPSERLDLILIYQDVQPNGNCLAELFDSQGALISHRNAPCGLESFTLPLPPKMTVGRYRVDLRQPGGDLLHTYFFDYVVAIAPAIQ